MHRCLYRHHKILTFSSKLTKPALRTMSSIPSSTTPAAPALRFADVGINLSDPVYQGIYHGKQAHASDIDDVIQRARDVGCSKLMITGSDITESRRAIELAESYPGTCYATVGIHPCSAKTMLQHPSGASGAIAELAELASEARRAGSAVAFGEIGLDYDRLYLAKQDTQLDCFERQLDLAVELQMPLFLHSRAAAADFSRLLRARLDRLPRRGLVHSFTGSAEEMLELVEMGFDIGVNGCSLKTDENLEVVKAIPLERLQLETDGPWCEMRASHASARHLADAPPMVRAVKKEKWQKGCLVKGRNEPCTIIHVAHVVAAVKGVSVQEVCEAAWHNSANMFGLGIPK